ncbi:MULTISPECIES: hypothetical protein [unclassified Halomonas]|uniref:hypothetical protein n=1 Tax=unclassified Halomonas TaxID=2609666 RepID=UPI0007D99DA2|nr:MULTISPECIES: hypothetical protein [unclassified Halomonas]MBT2787782.1 hypothetical protein [Halomonas sp. ISL-106]MBT2799607.1 hypothetical protein [Halomonas sp. ISL-104]OAL61431.1 hypothetical protein A6R74_14565 [Halomonas sp. ALS9]
MNDRVNEILEKRKKFPNNPGMKINLYYDYEYISLASSLRKNSIENIESVMVGDSYFMTHMGLPSTRLNKELTNEAINILPSLIKEVRVAIDSNEIENVSPPLLMADIPDGISSSELLKIVNEYLKNGADIIKIEAETISDLWPLKEIDISPKYWAVHIGYTPQKNDNRVYGGSVEEIKELENVLDVAANLGARFVILERLTEIANSVLTEIAVKKNVVPYSIFSGRAFLGGQSLNIWDAVVKAEKESIFFPPTATIDRSDVKDKYNNLLIEDCITKLIGLCKANVFPPSPRNPVSVDEFLSIIKEYSL